MDLDRFKEINDTLGHRAGDLLLCELAERLERVLPPSVMLARLGGDELGLLANVGSGAEALELAAAVNTALRTDFVIQSVPVGIEASIGVALSPDHGDDIDTLMVRADLAMYEAKARHTGAAIYEQGLESTNEIEVGLLSELRRALNDGEIILHYQPKVDLLTGTIVGVEALVRWQHPKRGLVYPDQFLPYAERTGVNRSLSRYVLRAALAQTREWLDRGMEINMAVNVTMFDLLDPDFPNEVVGFLAELGVPATLLELELTESEIMSDVARARMALDRLRSQGVKIAIDDFGSGYSSLAYLKTLPVDTLKIDKAFVLGMHTDVRDDAIVKTAINLAHTFGLSVVAEGVETAAMFADLQAVGCTTAQGYYIARPEPATDATRRLLRARDTNSLDVSDILTSGAAV
jgi:diguanylate cyclase (GGDEF)-like protein